LDAAIIRRFGVRRRGKAKPKARISAALQGRLRRAFMGLRRVVRQSRKAVSEQYFRWEKREAGDEQYLPVGEARGGVNDTSQDAAPEAPWSAR